MRKNWSIILLLLVVAFFAVAGFGALMFACAAPSPSSPQPSAPQPAPSRPQPLNQQPQARMAQALNAAAPASVSIVGGHVTIQTEPALYGPGTWPSFFVAAKGGFWPNCDNSSVAPALNDFDFTCFLQKYAAQSPYANADDSTASPQINVLDFTAYLHSFARGRVEPVRVLRGTPQVLFADMPWIGAQAPNQGITIERSGFGFSVVPDSAGVVELEFDYSAVVYTREWRAADMFWPVPYGDLGLTPPPGLRCPTLRTDAIHPAHASNPAQ